MVSRLLVALAWRKDWLKKVLSVLAVRKAEQQGLEEVRRSTVILMLVTSFGSKDSLIPEQVADS